MTGDERAMPTEPGPRLTHDQIVEQWRLRAELDDDRNYSFLRSLKFKKFRFNPDELAAELHRQAFAMVDCTRCANCCKTMTVLFEAADIERIAAHLNLSPGEFAERYLEPENAEGERPLRQRPCAFLGPDDRCTIYEVRPRCCQEYPHTNKGGLAQRSMGLANNALVCPAVFYIVDNLRKRR